MNQVQKGSNGAAALVSRAIAKPRYLAAWTAGFLRTRPFVWELLNREGRAIHRRHVPDLDDVQLRVLHDLSQDGIALVHIDELFPDARMLPSMVETFEQHQDEGRPTERKPFLEYIYTAGSTIELDNPFIEFSLDRRILDVVNRYMEMCTKLIYFELAVSRVVEAGAVAAASQRWHRDPGMKRIVKTFLYLSDVNEDSGPFMYGAGTQLGGRHAKTIRQLQFGRHGSYPSNGVVESIVPQEDIRVCTGRAGTVVFADTIGLHKGGYSSKNSRTMYTGCYVAGGDALKPMFKTPAGFQALLPALNPVSRFSVS